MGGGGGWVGSPICAHMKTDRPPRSTRVREATPIGNLKSRVRQTEKPRGAGPLLTFEHGRDAKFTARSLTHPSGLTKTMSLECSKHMKFRKVLLQRRRVFREQELVGKRQPNVIHFYTKYRS